MFGRGKRAEPVTAAEEPEANPHGKGRPTPRRRDAQAARKEQLRTPKDSRGARRASRDRDREQRSKSRAAMMAGDERYFPLRDQGPARAFTRDFVDSRFTIAEFFIFFAIIVLALGFAPQQYQQYSSLGFFALTLVIAVDTTILLISLNIAAKKEFPNKADRKGITLYAALRVLQLRRLRLPKPRVKRGGAPVTPK